MANIKDKSKYKYDIAHVAWILLFLSLFSIVLRRDVQAIETLDTGNFFRIILVSGSIIISMGCLLLRKNGISVLFGGPQKWLAIYAFIALFSCSYASHGFYATWKAVEIFAHVLVIGAILSSADPEVCTESLFHICRIMFLVLIFCIWFGGLIRPSIAFRPIPHGIFPLLEGIWPPINANGVGFISGFLVVVYTARILDYEKKSKIFAIFVLILAGSALFFAQARTSLIGCAMAILIYILLCRKKLFFIGLVGLILCIALWGVGDYIIEYFRRGQNAELFYSLSGRTLAWNAAMAYFKESPLIGHGYASAGRFDLLGGGKASTLHGAVFEVLVGVGIFGLVPWLLSIISTTYGLWVTAYRSKEGDPEHRSLKALAFAIMIFVIIRATTSSELSLHYYSFLVFDILVCMSWNWMSLRQTVVRPIYASNAFHR